MSTNIVKTSRSLFTTILLATGIFLYFSNLSFAASTGTLLPTSDGTYAAWTPSAGATHYTLVDEAACNGVTDYVSETTVGERDSYGVSLTTIPNGSTITQIQITPCASRNAGGGGGSATLNVFYRYAGVNSADAGAYALTGTTPAGLSATSFSSLNLAKVSTSTLEIGAVYTSGTKGARLSRLATVITYTPPLPTVTTNAATLVGSTTATLNGSAVPNGATTTGWFRYATSNPVTCSDSFGTRAPSSGGTVLGFGSSSVNYSRAVTGLVPDMTYYACAIASSTAGTAVGSVVSFTTLPSVPPTAPSGASAVNVSGTQNDVSWTDNSSSETGFKVERSTNGGAYAQIATTSANATTYSDTAATADQTYVYRVRAYNVAGNSSYSTTGSVITATVVPNAPSSLSTFVGTSTPTDVFLFWSHSGSNEAGFKVYRSDDNVNFTEVTSVGANFTSASDTPGVSGTYYYKVTAYNAIGDCVDSNTETVIIP